jgi:hypothetical protein
MPWLRLWVDILDDPDLDALPDDVALAWFKLLAVAKRNDPQGELPPLRRLPLVLRRPAKKVEAWVGKLIAAGFIDVEGETMRMHGWERWQPKEPMSNAERQAKFRESKKVSSLDSPSGEEKRGEEKSNVTPLLSVTPVTDAPPPLRNPEDQKQFDEAVELLSRSLQTQPLSMELNRRSSLAGVIAVRGWQWLVAARKFADGKAKKGTFDYLQGIASNATRDEFADYKRTPMSGPDKPTPKIYGAIQGP